MLEIGIFLLLGVILPKSTAFPPNDMFGGRVAQSIHGGGNKKDDSRGNMLSNIEKTRSVIQGDNSPGIYFVLRDSIPMILFK